MTCSRLRRFLFSVLTSIFFPIPFALYSHQCMFTDCAIWSRGGRSKSNGVLWGYDDTICYDMMTGLVWSGQAQCLS
ncbi:hypothetical protein BJX62DRAFT_210396 [Aspergillus germanicus]